MKKAKILVIEDEKDLIDAITINLVNNGYEVQSEQDGISGLEAARQMKPDLIVLDLMLPVIGGYDICKLLKTDLNTSTIPIIIISAKDKDTDIVRGLDIGADDYLTKPFSIQILIARINNLLRRYEHKTIKNNATREFGELKIDLQKKSVFLKDKNINLTVTEFKILNTILSNPDVVMTRDEIIKSTHGSNYSVTHRSIDFQISALRKKLKNYSEIISTIRGFGYQLNNSYVKQ